MALLADVRNVHFIPVMILILSVQNSNSMTSTSAFTSAAPELEPEDLFIIDLVNQPRFSECSLVFFQDRHDSSESVTKILKSLERGEKSYYSIKYAFPTSEKFLELSELSKNLSDFLNTPPVQFPKNFRTSSRKLGSPCLLTVLFLNDLRSQFVQQIYNLLTPVYMPLTRKDEDFYIFKTKSNFHRKLLFMNELPFRIKFKVAVGATDQIDNPLDPMVPNSSIGTSNLQISTMCFFCDPGGNPRLLELPVSDFQSKINYFPDFVQNLNGRLLYVSFPYMRAKIEAEYPYEGISNAWRGHWKNLFEEWLTVKFNFSYNAFAATGRDGRKGGGGTGVQLSNGTWVGVTGDLISGRADIGIGILNTPKRIHYIGFTNSFYDTGCLTFMIAQPRKIYSPAALLWPFSLGMWMGIVISSVLSLLFVNLCFRVMTSDFYIQKEKPWTFTLQIQFLLATFLEDGSPVLPVSQPIRIFVVLWFLFTMIVTNAYRSKLVTILAFPISEEIPQTFEQLAFHRDYDVGFLRHGDSAYNTLKASRDPVYVKLVNEMEIFSGYGEKCLEKVVQVDDDDSGRKYGCIAYDFSLVHLRERNMSLSDTRRVKFAPDAASTYHSYFGLGTEARSILRLNFGRWLGVIRSFHLPIVWNQMDMYKNVRLRKLEWWAETNQTEKMSVIDGDDVSGGSRNLKMKNFAGAFYVLIVCHILSCAVFAQEILSFRWRKIGGRLVCLVLTWTWVAPAALALKRLSTKRNMIRCQGQGQQDHGNPMKIIKMLTKEENDNRQPFIIPLINVIDDSFI